MKHKDRPFYRKKYQNELIAELVGPTTLEAAKKYMKRNKLTLKEYLIKLYDPISTARRKKVQ